MCDTCGCNITHGNEHLIATGGKLEKTESGREAVTVLHSLLHENDHSAQHNRQHFNSHAVIAINLMSSPGAGKTGGFGKASEFNGHFFGAIHFIDRVRNFFIPDKRFIGCIKQNQGFVLAGILHPFGQFFL